MTTRTVSSLALLGGVLLLLAISVGCGAKETTASKSAAAFDEAQRKGTAPTVGGAHGGHAGAEASPVPAAAAPTGGASPSSVDHSKMAGMRQAKAPGGGGAVKGMDHSKMAGMDHAKTPAGSGATTGMDHSKTSGMAGSVIAHGTMPPPQPQPASTAAKPGQPVATLGPDDIDAPAPTSVTDAARSAAMAQEMSAGHGMQHGTYRQIDAGRDSVAPKRDEGHEGHETPPPPSAAPTTRAPKVAPPAARPDRKKPPTTQPSPSPDPHQMHTAPATPRPSPTPGVKDEKR